MARGGRWAVVGALVFVTGCTAGSETDGTHAPDPIDHPTGSASATGVVQPTATLSADDCLVPIDESARKAPVGTLRIENVWAPGMTGSSSFQQFRLADRGCRARVTSSLACPQDAVWVPGRPTWPAARLWGKGVREIWQTALAVPSAGGGTDDVYQVVVNIPDDRQRAAFDIWLGGCFRDPAASGRAARRLGQRPGSTSLGWIVFVGSWTTTQRQGIGQTAVNLWTSP